MVNGDGLIGRVTAVTGSTSKVTLISDHSSKVSVRIVPSGVQGLVKATVGDPNHLVLGFLNSDKNIHKGEAVVTAGWHGEGIESRFPPNIPVGEVTKATLIEQEAQERSVVRPYADLSNLDTVQVLTGEPASDPHPENSRPPAARRPLRSAPPADLLLPGGSPSTSAPTSCPRWLSASACWAGR